MPTQLMQSHGFLIYYSSPNFLFPSTKEFSFPCTIWRALIAEYKWQKFFIDHLVYHTVFHVCRSVINKKIIVPHQLMSKEDFIQDSCNNGEKLSSIPTETKGERDFNHQHELLAKYWKPLGEEGNWLIQLGHPCQLFGIYKA